MAMTRTQMISEICDTVGKARGAGAVSGTTLEARVVYYLNWGQKRIARHYSFQELDVLKTNSATVTDVKRYPIVSGTNTLGLVRPKDIQSIKLVDSENSRKLDRWSYRKFDRYYPRPENFVSARPRLYVRHGNWVELFRIPNAVYTLHIRYPQWPLDLTSANQTSDYENKDELLVTVGILETYLALEEYEDVTVWWAKFKGMLTDAVHVEGDVDWEPEAEPFGARPGYGSGEPWIDPYGGVGDPLYGYPE